MHDGMTILLSALLLLAAWHDRHHYRIPNWLVGAGAVAALLLHGLLPTGAGWQATLLGLMAGFVLFLPFYLLRVMGAGDVKLMAMVGAFVGPGAIVGVTLYVLVAGGVLAIGMTLLRGRMAQLLDNFRLMLLLKMTKSPDWWLPIDATAATTVNKLPYGVAIASGTIAYLLTI